MYVKVVFVFEYPKGGNPVEKAEELIRAHVEGGDPLLDDACVCIINKPGDAWRMVVEEEEKEEGK